MPSDDRSKVRGERHKRLAVNFMLLLVAFLVAQGVVVMAAAFSLVFHPQAGLPLELGLWFLPAGAFGLLVTIRAMQVWARERERLREADRTSSDIYAAFWRSLLIGNSTVAALGVFILWFRSGGLPWELGAVLVVLGSLGILVTSYYTVLHSRRSDRLPARNHPGE